MQNPEKFVAGHLERKNKMEDIEKLIKELREHVDSEINRDLMVNTYNYRNTYTNCYPVCNTYKLYF